MRALRLALGWGWAAAIVWLSVTHSPPTLGFEGGDKVGHFGAYGLLMLWFCTLYVSRRSRLAYAVGFIALGVALEFVQRAIGYRDFEIGDMVADAIGVAGAWVGIALIEGMLSARRASRRAPRPSASDRSREP